MQLNHIVLRCLRNSADHMKTLCWDVQWKHLDNLLDVLKSLVQMHSGLGFTCGQHLYLHLSLHHSVLSVWLLCGISFCCQLLVLCLTAGRNSSDVWQFVTLSWRRVRRPQIKLCIRQHLLMRLLWLLQPRILVSSSMRRATMCHPPCDLRYDGCYQLCICYQIFLSSDKWSLGDAWFYVLSPFTLCA